ncbi:NAD(P)/FAD-dependent oxidoreductase [Propionivibrio soli]|uniref:NAD(P)/FAD-dependent oxidoreductase n=1 Tax=Propionivibrio soli TaxID=2976531 RepID=UPI0021E91963|nr:NAD(P)/FAD-dependent oxidoreductase [Propionivibrio soli]
MPTPTPFRSIAHPLTLPLPIYVPQQGHVADSGSPGAMRNRATAGDDRKDNRRDEDIDPSIVPADALKHPGPRHRIVIVGGGAGGLELAARLGDDLGRHEEAEIVLVDLALTHLWKPLLHEVAAGTLGPHENEFDYLQQARDHRFRFQLGRLEAIDRKRKEIWLAPLVGDDGMEVAPHRSLTYDTLVIAIGAIDNDFNTPGVREYAHSLNDKDDAQRFHRRLLALCARSEMVSAAPVRVVIVGGGATGVELAAELSSAVDVIASYGVELKELRRPVHITLTELAPRLLGALPEEVARRVHEDLEQRGIAVRVGQKVESVDAGGVVLAGGERIDADLTVWAAGIQGQSILKTLGDLETNRLGQLIVRRTLQTTRDEDIFAMGDCSNCIAPEGTRPPPPTAQAASQQAQLLAQSLPRRLAGKPLLEFTYHERGSIVSLGGDEAIGKVSTRGRDVTIQGRLARLTYWALYRRHLNLLLGTVRTALMTVGQWLSRRSQPRVKLH